MFLKLLYRSLQVQHRLIGTFYFQFFFESDQRIGFLSQLWIIFDWLMFVELVLFNFVDGDITTLLIELLNLVI